MAWKMHLLVMFSDIILIHSQDDAEAITHAPSFWTWMTGDAFSLEVTMGLNIPTTEDQRPMTTGETDPELLVTNEMLVGAMSGDYPLTWTEENTRRWAGPTFSAAENSKQWNSEGNKCSTYTIIANAAMPCVISVLGLIGNALSIMVFWLDSHKSASAALLVQLAIVDSFVLVIWSLLLLSRVLESSIENTPFVVSIASPCKYAYGWPAGVLIQRIATWLIVTITIQRYVAVCHPHKMRLMGSVRIAWIQLAVLVILCVLFSIPHFLEFRVIALDNGVVVNKPVWFLANPVYKLYYQGIAFYLINFVIPSVLLMFFTTSIIRQLRKSKIKVKARPNPTETVTTMALSAQTKAEQLKNQLFQAKETKTDNSITLSLVVVDIVFFLCQIIIPIRRFTEYLLPPEQKLCGMLYSYIEPMTALGGFINSSVNFIIFCLCSRGFRKKLIQCLYKRNQRIKPTIFCGTSLR